MATAEFIHIALQSDEDGFKRIDADLTGVCKGVLNSVFPIIVDKDGIVDLPVLIILEPCGLGSVEIAVGVIPLGIHPTLGQLGHEGLKVLHISFLLVEEVAVKAHVFRDFHQLVDQREIAVFVLCDQIGACLAGTKGGIKIDAGDRHDAVFVRSVGVG